MKQKSLFGNQTTELSLKEAKAKLKKKNENSLNQVIKNKVRKCQRCDREIFCWMLIKKKPICCDCFKSLKEYFEEKNITKGKDIRLCSCCRKYKEIGFIDSYSGIPILICNDCIKNFAPYLKLMEVCIKNG